MSFILSEEEKAHLKYLSEKLTPRQKTILKLKTFTVEKNGKILWECKQKDIAYFLGISEPTVSREWKIIEKAMKERGSNSDCLRREVYKTGTNIHYAGDNDPFIKRKK